MATPAYKLRFTYEDYLLFPDDGRRHELIGGEHYVSPSPVKKHQRAAVAKRQGTSAVPELVIEILSDSTRKTDETIKRKLYEWAGVIEYWIVDPVLETVKVYRLNGGVYERVAELSVEAGDRLETPLLPGLTIAVSQIFN